MLFGSTLTNVLQTVDRLKIRSSGSISGVHRELLPEKDMHCHISERHYDAEPEALYFRFYGCDFSIHPTGLAFSVVGFKVDIDAVAVFFQLLKAFIDDAHNLLPCG